MFYNLDQIRYPLLRHANEAVYRVNIGTTAALKAGTVESIVSLSADVEMHV